ncbi:MAG: hypothetical protein ACLRW4_02895 [Ruminococcus sp.]
MLDWKITSALLRQVDFKTVKEYITLYFDSSQSIETAIGLLFALFFGLNYKGSKIIRSLMMAPLMIAPLVAGLTWKLMMSSSFGIVNELTGKNQDIKQQRYPLACR